MSKNLLAPIVLNIPVAVASYDIYFQLTPAMDHPRHMSAFSDLYLRLNQEVPLLRKETELPALYQSGRNPLSLTGPTIRY